METDWFTLRDARLQLLPYTRPRFEVAVAAQVSPSGPRLAGKHGLSLLSIGATRVEGYNAMETAWTIMEDRAAEFGTSVDRDGWRLVGPMHIAETRKQAKEDVKYGLAKWLDYFINVAALPIAPQGATVEEAANIFIESGFAVIGTPDDAIEQMQRLEKQSGGFGCYLFMAHDWADRERTMKSYELFAKYVMPAVNEESKATRRSLEWARDNRSTFMPKVGEAIMNSIQSHAQEQQDKASKQS